MPSSSDDNKLPILGLKVWIDKENKKVKHMFYKKPMARLDMISYRTAIPTRMKKTMLIEEGWRRVRNFSSSIEMVKDDIEVYSTNDDIEMVKDDFKVYSIKDNIMQDEIMEVLKMFNKQMMTDGHSEFFRAQITKAVIRKWKERKNMDLLGIKSYYRRRKE